MKIGLIGRTRLLLDLAKMIHNKGHEIPFMLTAKSELPYYVCDLNQIEEFAKSIDADYYFTSKINDPELVEKIKSYECDIAVTFNWINILKKPICDAFKIGMLNIHGGDLPKYRGNACQAWAILNEEDKIGLCVHMIEPDNLDSGDIIVKEYMPLAPDTYVGEFFDWFEERTIPLYMKAIEMIESGQRNFEKQSLDPKAILRCYPRKPEDARINWKMSGHEIYKLIRACGRPYAGAFCFFQDRKMVIHKAKIIQHLGNYCAIPGQVLYGQNQNAVIACGDGIIELTEVSLEDCPSHEEAQKQIMKSFRNRLD